MGLFSGKDVTNVGTEVQRVIDDTKVPDSVANGAAKNLYANDEQLVEYVLEEMVGSMGLRAGRMMEYGRKDYAYGLPNSTLKSSAAGKDAALAAIRALSGPSAVLEYYHFGAFNNLHYGWKTLADQYAYNSTANTLVVAGKTVYLKDMQVVVTNATLEELANGSMAQWGTPPNSGYTPERTLGGAAALLVSAPTPFAVDQNAPNDYIRVDYCWVEQVDVVTEGVTVKRDTIKTGSFQFPVSGMDAQADYHQAKYIYNGRAYYWTYRHGQGTNPAVDAVFNTAYAAGGSFMPWVYFRFNKTSALADKTSQWYKDSKKMCSVIKMDFDTVAKAINDNPDIKDVEQAMLMMAVPAKTDNPVEQRYLFDFFSGIYDEMQPVPNATFTTLSFMGMQLVVNGMNQETSIIIQDKRFKMALSYRGIARRFVAGTIGKVGRYASSSNSDEESKTIPMIGGGTMSWTTDKEVHSYRKQVTAEMYEEVQVYGLKTTFWIFENYTTIGNDKDKTLIIPINEAITKHYSVPDREELYSRSLHYVFNSRLVTHLKWYQTGVFRVLMIIIAVVITIISDGTTFEALMAAIAAGAVSTVITMILVQIITQIIIQAAVKLFVKIVGTKLAFIAAVVAAVLGAYQIYTNGALTNLPTGAQLLSASSSISQGVSKQIASDIGDLRADFENFEHEKEAKEKVLETAESLLNTGLRVDPIVIFGETPSQFYQRTVHSGNIGMVGIDVVSNYVDMALQLPKLNDSLGDLV
jgi:hypothetical protein